jgi:UDP-perosamine 4-acetyltransferase
VSILVVGLGAGGHAKVVIETLRLDGRYEIIGLLDRNPDLLGKSVLGVPILGDDEELPVLKARGVECFFVGLGGVVSLAPRRRLYESALGLGLEPVPVLHPGAFISPSAVLGQGPTVMAAAVVNAQARIGENVILNTGAIVEHDCVIGSHVHIATGARLAGDVVIGEETLIGAGAVVRQGLRIGPRALVGAGAVVVKDVPGGQMVVGNPARPRERRGDASC